MEGIDPVENEARMLRGELYYAFLPGLTAKRNRCHHACKRFNNAGDASRRKLVELWKEVVDDKTPLPPPGATEAEDFKILQDEPYIDGPVAVDYGVNLRSTPFRLGTDVYINFNCTFLDTCLITIGSRTLIGPNCSFYSATHPLDPFLRNDRTKRARSDTETVIGEDKEFDAVC
ncbi:hypothetical protein CJF32_00010290 [Rutstroemia sp. NJR-2017a WRK4]|nr:hypothetical protein CJF32_00010290 [Rutstroemia sp. NJR-2017a WRK4]